MPESCWSMCYRRASALKDLGGWHCGSCVEKTGLVQQRQVVAACWGALDCRSRRSRALGVPALITRVLPWQVAELLQEVQAVCAAEGASSGGPDAAWARLLSGVKRIEALPQPHAAGGRHRTAEPGGAAAGGAAARVLQPGVGAPGELQGQVLSAAVASLC